MNGTPVFKILESTRKVHKCSAFGKVERFTEISASTDGNFLRAKPYEAIPGPKLSAFLSGDFLKLALGKYESLNYLQVHKKLFQEFGPILRLPPLPAKNAFIYDPNYTEAVYRNETIYPKREGFDFVQLYLKDVNRDGYVNGGVFFKNGPDWHEIRSAVNKAMLHPKSAQMYMEPLQQVTTDFIARIKSIRPQSEEMPENFHEEIRKWALEALGVVTLNTRFGCLNGDLHRDSDAYKLNEASKNFVESAYLLNCYPYTWKYVSTPSWRLFVSCLETFNRIIRQRVLEKINLKKESHQSVLQSILKLKEDDPMVAVTLIIDLFIAGIDTTSNAAASAMYHLARNPEKQELLHRELKRFLPSKKSPITCEILNELKYVKCCIKESMRISPVVPFLYRTLTKETAIGGYQIPAGAYITSNQLLMCNSERNFKYADKFLPERWLKSESSSEISVKNTHPYLFLPYGFGARSCLGKRFAELELELLIAKMFRNFRLEYNHGEMIWSRKFLYCCGKPLQFKMENRPD